MSILFVYPVSSPELPNKVLTHIDDIASTLAEQGVHFERLPVATPIRPGTDAEQVLEACRTQLEPLMSRLGVVASEVISLDPSHPQRVEHCAAFLRAQQQNAHEVRFFLGGRGLLSLHIGDYVYAVLCERNDVISIPAGTAHWFDLGEEPRCVAIRLFDKAEGRVSTFVEDDLAGRFPGLDD
ncbi:acireductone dioxygenase [Pseudomonas asplenii]|uniref:acireductone dioxygenase n=1 Tax=Pseudomonas asplenii TaxID=53407 RepID=UPI0037CB05E4